MGKVKEEATCVAGASVAVKICGIREAETLRAMRGLPVEYVGFVFAPSRRQVTPGQAGALVAAARDIPMAGGRPPRTVGVFVNPSLAELERTLRVAPLDVVQLHGAETPAFCREVALRFGVHVWRALAVDDGGAIAGSEADGARAGAAGAGSGGACSGAGVAVSGGVPATAEGPATVDKSATVEDSATFDVSVAVKGPDAGSLPVPAGAARLDAYRGAVTAILLDTAGGGTGRTFRWDVLPAYRAAARRNGLALIVAGGLTPDNVRPLIDAYRPDGVDVSSGVETDGRKDIAKIAAFVERVKRT